MRLLRSRKSSQFDLDSTLFKLSSKDAWTIRDACEGTAIFGSIGSGKTSGSGATIARAFLNAGMGGLVMCAKPEERKLWEHYAAQTGREKDLVIFSPENDWRFNFLTYEQRRKSRGGGQTENLVNLFSTIVEIAEGNQGSEGGGDQFWNRAMKEMIRNCLEVLSIGQDEIRLNDIYNLIVTAPQNEAQTTSEEWRKSSFCYQAIQAAIAADKTEMQIADLNAALRYWTETHARMADRTRSSIVATFTSIADMMLHGVIRELFTTEINLVPETSYMNGSIIIVDLPIQQYREVGKITQGIMKYIFQTAILRRDPDEDPRPVFLWADEAQNFITSFDYQFQAVARSARACTVYLTQNISNYISTIGGINARDETNALLGNLVTKIFHSNTSDETNMLAAEIIGQDWQTVRNYSTSRGQQQDAFRTAGGQQMVNYKVLPVEFTKLKKGGKPNKLIVEAIVFQGGRSFKASGDTYLKTQFKQM